MKKIFAILILITAGYTAGYSQSVFLEIDTTKPYTELYYFNEFSPGTIQFRDGTVFNGQLNILLASSTLCFLDKEGLPDIFSDISQVSAVLIDRNYFVPLLGHYMQILDTDGNVMFGVEQYLELEAEKRYGAFGREEKSPNVPIEKRNLRSEGFNITTGGRSLAVETTPYTVHQGMLREANIEPSSRKGNYTLTSFDKSIRIEVNINELIEFDENINLAHMKLHEFIEMKTNGADSDIVALIHQAFTTRKGRLDKARIFGLFSLNITHPLWQEAMELIRKSINRNSTVRYMEIAEKDENGRYVPIRLNFATI